MIINTTPTFSVLEDERTDIKDFANYLAYKVKKSFADQNLIINLLKYNNLTLEQLLLFLETSNTHRAGKHSFVLVATGIDPDILPDELLVVPTLQEAEDVIEMEEIERDLGF